MIPQSKLYICISLKTKFILYIAKNIGIDDFNILRVIGVGSLGKVKIYNIID